MDYCFPVPCVNGICINDASTYQCQCDDGFTGATCDAGNIFVGTICESVTQVILSVVVSFLNDSLVSVMLHIDIMIQIVKYVNW